MVCPRCLSSKTTDNQQAARAAAATQRRPAIGASSHCAVGHCTLVVRSWVRMTDVNLAARIIRLARAVVHAIRP